MHADILEDCGWGGKCGKTPLNCDKKKLSTRRPKIDPEIGPVKETSGLDCVLCFMVRNLCGLWGLEQFNDFFFNFVWKVAEVEKSESPVRSVSVNPDLRTLQDVIEHLSLTC